jgi:hypothetical protein
MCGIAGIYAYHYAANPVEHAELIWLHLAPMGLANGILRTSVSVWAIVG